MGGGGQASCQVDVQTSDIDHTDGGKLGNAHVDGRMCETEQMREWVSS